MKDLRIAHISPDVYERSSSFIQANISGLLGTVIPFYGGYFPTGYGQNSMIQLDLWDKIKFKILGKINGLNRAEYALYKVLKQQKIDLVFTEYGPSACAMIHVLRQLSIPVVIHFHGYDVYHQPTVTKHKSNYDKLIGMGAHAIAVSKEMRQELIHWGFPEHRVIYSPCGCHARFVQLPVQSHRQGFIAVGRMVEKKGPLFTIQAFEYALKKGMQDQLTFIGDGPLLASCQEYVQRNGLSEHIHFLGHQSHDFVLESMLKSRIFLQHSVTSSEGDKEGTPVSIAEAMAVEMPVISTFHAGIQDVVTSGENGYLVHEKDIAGMGDFILELSNNQERCMEMGKTGRITVENHYTDILHLKSINQFIGQIMS